MTVEVDYQTKKNECVEGMGIAQSMDEDKGKQQRPTRKPAANALKPVNENEIKVLLLGPGDTGKSNVQPARLSIHE